MNTILSTATSLFMVSVLMSLSCTLQQPTEAVEKDEESNGIYTHKVISRPDLQPLVESETNAHGVKAILATNDIGIGANRISFLLTSPRGFVTVPVVAVKPALVSETGAQASDMAPIIATFHPWPYGKRGLYVATINFDSPGSWILNVSLTEDNEASMVSIPVGVRTRTQAPMNGDVAIKSNNRTLADVQDVEELTTGSLHDPDLYQISIADAILRGRAAVVVFASPAFCLNAVCGPQVEVVQKLKATFGEAADFIHVDFYDNPREIQGDLTRAIISPTVREWGLPSSEWTFMIDQHGHVFKRFEGFANYSELAQELASMLSVSESVSPR